MLAVILNVRIDLSDFRVSVNKDKCVTNLYNDMSGTEMFANISSFHVILTFAM